MHTLVLNHTHLFQAFPKCIFLFRSAFDTEGVNEIAKCNVDYYSIEYENKAIYKMFQSEKNFELESYIEEEKKENENNEQEE